MLSWSGVRNRLIPIEYCGETVISCAQNNEDVLINRAMRGRKSGFYVDVGAGDPNWDSVTNWFYRMGWRGINIEPNPEIFKQLQVFRKKDVNLNIGVSVISGSLPYYQVKQNEFGHGWGASSFDSRAIEVARSRGLAVDVIDVAVSPLWELIRQYIPRDGVDFLKIDVEGLEAQVISSANLSAWMPKLICVGAVEPNSCKPSFEKWERMIASAGYVFAIFDGMNNYYVRNNLPEMLSQLAAGVNANDRYRRCSHEDFVLAT